jgi:hypothetical protein
VVTALDSQAPGATESSELAGVSMGELEPTQADPGNRLLERMLSQIQDLADSQENPPAPAGSRNASASNALGTIFDLSAPFWKTYDELSAISNLATELQMLDLVEQEGIAEENADFDLDPTLTNFITP